RQRHRTFGKKSSYGQVLPSPQPCNADRAFPPSNHGARPQPVPALKLLTQIEAFGAKLGRSCCCSVGQDSANIDPESGIKARDIASNAYHGDDPIKIAVYATPETKGRQHIPTAPRNRLVAKAVFIQMGSALSTIGKPATTKVTR